VASASGAGGFGAGVTVFSYNNNSTLAIQGLQEFGGTVNVGIQVDPVVWQFSGPVHDYVTKSGPGPLGGL